MLRHSCDNCKKTVKEDYVGVHVAFEMYHFCVPCIKFIPSFLKKVLKKKESKKK